MGWWGDLWGRWKQRKCADLRAVCGSAVAIGGKTAVVVAVVGMVAKTEKNSTTKVVGQEKGMQAPGPGRTQC